MQPVVLFDGQCNLCNGAVRFLRRRDRTDRLRFVPLDSDDARQLIAANAARRGDSKDGTSILGCGDRGARSHRDGDRGAEPRNHSELSGLHRSPEPDTFILLENGRTYDRSTAALRTLRLLGGLWPLVYSLILVPRPLRDAIYTFVARRRRQWFGTTDRCEL